MTIDFICDSFLDFLRQNNYRKTDMYTTEIGRQFSEDVLGIKTGEFNISKFHYRGRLLRDTDIHQLQKQSVFFLPMNLSIVLVLFCAMKMFYLLQTESHAP